MQAPNIFLRTAKFLGKVILGLLLIFLTVVVLIHLPPVQKQITHTLSNYLSSKIEAKVDIQSITFSVLGNVIINDLAVWDRAKNKLVSIHKIEVKSSLFDLVKGDLIFDEVSIVGLEGKLVQSESGLNIQFIMDAFKSGDNRDTTKSSPVNLQFKKVLLENMLFEFTSTLNGISVTVNLGKLAIQEAGFITQPTKIKADQVILQRTLVNTISTFHADTHNNNDTVKDNLLILPDFGTGIIFDVRNLELTDDEVSFHKDQVTDTKKFDPSHISLKNIQITLSDILIRNDTLAAGLQSLSAQLPGFTLDHAKTDIKLNRHELVLSGLHLAFGKNEIEADITVPNEMKLSQDVDHTQAAIAMQCLINPKDFAYFFSDSLMNQFMPWGPSEFALECKYVRCKGKLKTLDLKTGNSLLHAEGIVNDIQDLKRINWNDLVVNASIGSDFRRTIIPLLPNINIPPDVKLQLKSSGNLNNIYAVANVFTKWGDVQATGQVTQLTNNLDIDMSLTGEKVDLGEWINVSSLGPMDLSLNAKGIIGDTFEINGLINNIEILEQSIHDIAFQSNTRKDSATVSISIADPSYRSEINSEISFAGPLIFANTIQLDSFRLGRLLNKDSTLLISGDTKSKIIIEPSSQEAHVAGKHMLFHKQSRKYSMDTLDVHALISPTKSEFTYLTDNAKANLISNFDIRDVSEVIGAWSGNVVSTPDHRIHTTGTRAIHFNIDLENANFIKLLGINVDEFSSLQLTGEFDEQKESAVIQARSGKFNGYGISLDTLNANLIALRDSANLSMNVSNLFYESIPLGNLDFEVLTEGDTAISTLLLTTDSITTIGLRSRILPTDSGAFFYPDLLRAFNNDYLIDPKNPVFLQKDNIVFNHFLISRDDMQINMDGDLNYFDIMLKQVDLTPLNFLLSSDTTIINQGLLTGNFSYSRDQQLDIQMNIDSLSLYHSNPLTLTATAVSEGTQIPFEFLLTNESNKVDLKGNYFTDNTEVDAALLLDVNNLELFSFLVSGFVADMNGAIQGKATIRGPIKKPAFKGSLRFLDLGLTTINPKLTFNVKDDSIVLDNSSMVFNHFTLYDKEDNPLIIDGNVTSKDYQSLAYDLHINSDQYTLVNNPDSTSGQLRGLLVIDSDIKLKGNEKDTKIEANLTIKNATDLTYVNSKSGIELLKAEGIVDFIDPAQLLDSAAHDQSINFYDSLISSLPHFNLNSKVTIEDKAELRVVIDEQSGDYIEASGGANLELGYDRTGNLSLAGNYTIKKGVYRLSFYDLVKKNFTLVQGSSINWRGSPKNGDLAIKATHTVASNSLGLIGHEIGENEKSIYKRSLDYEVGINIDGTIEKPIISFSLDLPQNERVNFPVLANKLDRLRQPEFASELNKQVFGLIVLGGFLPESSADVNSSVIATTALSNSVNSLLSSQLNRFASQYIKGVNIDVGIQSFSDYSAPGGNTQTAMDVRVSKKIMNDRLSFEIGGNFDINQDQSGGNTGNNYRGDFAIIYDLTGNGDKQLKLFNNETFDIIFQEVRNTGIALIVIREFANKEEKNKEKEKEKENRYKNKNKK